MWEWPGHMRQARLPARRPSAWRVCISSIGLLSQRGATYVRYAASLHHQAYELGLSIQSGGMISSSGLASAGISASRVGLGGSPTTSGSGGVAYGSAAASGLGWRIKFSAGASVLEDGAAPLAAVCTAPQ